MRSAMPDQQSDLNDILNGVETPEPEAQPEAQAAPEPAPETPPRDEHGRFAPKGDNEPEPAPVQAAPPAVQEDDGPTVPRKALQDERTKRQSLESQLAEAAQTIAQFEQQANPPPPPPSVFDDEQGALDYVRQDAISAAVHQASFNARLDMSEMMVRQSHPDFEEKKAAFIEAMKATPGLQQRALQDPHPWSYAYNYVVSQQRAEQLGAVNVADLEAKLRAQITAELEAKGQEALSTGLPRSSVPPSLSQERNVGNRSTGPTWNGPASLGDILSS